MCCLPVITFIQRGIAGQFMKRMPDCINLHLYLSSSSQKLLLTN
jgi:hypothetical protein